MYNPLIKDAIFADCWIAFFNGTFCFKTDLESEVFNSISGWIIDAKRFFGNGRLIISSELMSLTRVNPPSRTGATLSAWILPLANYSPFMANLINSFLENVFPKSSLIQNTAPAELAALLPIPLPDLIPL